MLKKFIILVYLFTIFAGTLSFNSRTVNSQDFTYQKSYQDYEFTQGKYNQKLTDFNTKKAAYQKNPTLSLKEELRLSLYDLLLQRSDYIKSYLTSLRLRVAESKGLDQTQKESIYSKIDAEVKWYEDYKKTYSASDLLETLIDKSKADDSRWSKETNAIINYALSLVSLGDVVSLRTQHETIYQSLKNEANNLVSLGRADNSLFSRWFNDIEAEINKIKVVEDQTKASIDKMVSAKESFSQNRSFDDAIKTITAARTSLLRLNNFISELENVIETKR